MSVLPAEVSAQLAQLLQQLQATDNTVRSQAEEVLQNQWTNQRPEWLLMGLAEQTATGPSASVCRSARPLSTQDGLTLTPVPYRRGPSRPSFSVG